jgi:hypothetical protein
MKVQNNQSSLPVDPALSSYGCLDPLIAFVQSIWEL